MRLLPSLFIGCSVLIFVSCTQATPPAAAIPDDPYDLYTKTQVTGTVPVGGIFYKGDVLPVGTEATVEDYCYTDMPDISAGTGSSLKEFILEKGMLNFGDRNCACTDGACAVPPAVASCTDSDGGTDVFTRGTVVGITQGEDFPSVFEDFCAGESEIVTMDEKTGNTVRTGKKTPGTDVLEGKCLEGLTYYYDWVPCEKGCVDGACKK